MDKEIGVERLMVSFPQHILDALDRMRGSSGTSRSAFLALLVSDEEQRRNDARMRDAILARLAHIEERLTRLEGG